MDKQKKNIVFSCLIVVGILLSSIYLKNTRQQIRDTEGLPRPPTLMIDRLLGESGWEETKTYINTMYGYSIEYPARYLSPLEVESPNSVAIIWNDLARTMEGWISYFSFGQIEIQVSVKNENLSFESLKKSFAIGRTFIGKTTIAGYDAMVFMENPPSNPSILYGYCKDNRSALFAKGDVFFIVRTCTINHERVWAGFKFE